MTVGEYLARTEIEFTDGTSNRTFICEGKNTKKLMEKQVQNGGATCDVDIITIWGKAITLSIKPRNDRSIAPLILYQFMEPAKSDEFKTDSGESKIWNRRSKIVEMLQYPDPNYKKTDTLFFFLDQWFGGLSMVEKKKCFEYMYTNIIFTGMSDNVRDMLINYSLEHNFYNLIFNKQ